MAHNADHVESERDGIERDAFNAAFRELGLRWHWDAPTFAELKSIADDGERIRAYLESRAPHLLKAYDAEFLVDAVRSVKSDIYSERLPRTVRRYADCADFATAQTGF